jgi:DNA repair protein RadC
MKAQKFLRMPNTLTCEYRLREFQTCLVNENKNLYSEKITNSRDVYQLFLPYFQPYLAVKEVSYAIFLNRTNIPIGIYKISEGGIAGTIIDKRLVAKTAIELLASSVIIAHNHPSDNLHESGADIKITKELSQALQLFDIALIDHLILTSTTYKSFADEGLL